MMYPGAKAQDTTFYYSDSINYTRIIESYSKVKLDTYIEFKGNPDIPHGNYKETIYSQKKKADTFSVIGKYDNGVSTGGVG